MEHVKTSFSIKDLENLSGVKAHTIRIWEKRYKLLEPERTITNIRTYDLKSLQKLLNIAFLNNNGFKISKIADLTEEKMSILVRDLATSNNMHNLAIQSLKMAMMNFDQQLFQQTYANLLRNNSFRDVFYETFVPFMEEIGTLWQTNTINPAHEHFISCLIKQKVLINIERMQERTTTNDSKLFVLYLPENEIHDLGILFLNFELQNLGYQTVYLGPSIQLESLDTFMTYHRHPVFVTYMTVKPEEEHLQKYLAEFDKKLPKDKVRDLWILGRMARKINPVDLQLQQRTFFSIQELINELEQ